MGHPLVNGFDIIEKIGSGSFSIVYKATSKSTPNETVAIKCIDKQFQKKSFADNVIREISMLKLLKHEHVVQMKDFLWDFKHIFIIIEYCDAGDLAKYIRKHYKLRESLVQVLMTHLSKALKFLRQNNICHMDLKPQNLLLCSKPTLTLKVGDFGLSQCLTAESNEGCRFSGSPLYMAPEKLLHKNFDYRIDLWSVGIIMFECLFGRPPYLTINPHVVNLMSKHKPIELPKNANISELCEDLLRKLLKHNPNVRISFESYFEHPFLNVQRVPSLENYQRAHELIMSAQKLENDSEFSHALVLYEEAIDLLKLFCKGEHGIGNKGMIQLRLKEYEGWTAILKRLIMEKDGCLPTKKPAPLIQVNFDQLYTLASSTPQLKTALEIGQIGELYYAEGHIEMALEKITSSLNLLMPALQNEPEGLRKSLLHCQVQAWLGLGEALKTPEQPSTSKYVP